MGESAVETWLWVIGEEDGREFEHNVTSFMVLGGKRQVVECHGDVANWIVLARRQRPLEALRFMTSVHM